MSSLASHVPKVLGYRLGIGTFMNLKQLGQNWHEFGRRDPLWAILSLPGKEGRKWDLQEFFLTGQVEIEKALEFVASQDLRINYGRALDFGCGAGRLTQALAKHFDEAYGVDIAPSMIELAVTYNQYPDSCHYELNTKPDLSQFVDCHFDFIYSCRVLQHMKPEYALQYIGEFIRLLKPGGAIVIQEPTEKLVLASPTVQPKPEPVGFKVLLKKLIPQPLLNWYYKIRLDYLLSKHEQLPKMEMYGVPVEQMKAFVQDHGAVVRAVVPDYSCNDWASVCYCITKDR